MAKYAKRKKHSKASHRRRRVGAMALSPASPLVRLGSIAAGYFLADKINTPIDTAVGTKIDSKLIAAGEAGIGFLLAFKGKKSTAKSIIGGVLIGASIKRALKDFGVITGFYSVPVIGRKTMAGYHNVPVIGMNGYNVPAKPAGMQGYNVPAARNKVMNGCGDSSGSGINKTDR